jgi:formylglycine-generating enzyme required for sulfatase activity
LTRPFLLDIYEVTQAEYRRVMSARPSWFAIAGGGAEPVSGLDTDRFPVEQVTWFDAVEFCNRLSKLDGHPPYYQLTDTVREGGSIKAAAITIAGGTGYRLPSEAEWEYACRAWSTGAFHFGTYNTGREANLKPPVAAGGYGSPPTWRALARTAKVGSYKSNLYGLFDMHGNVAEWCGDWYEADYYAASPTADPPGPASGRHRVVRGGSWLVTQGSCRSASRYYLTPGDANHSTGFRVARMP